MQVVRLFNRVQAGLAEGKFKVNDQPVEPPSPLTGIAPPGSTPPGGGGGNGPDLKPLHKSLDKTTLDFIRKKSTDEIIESLKPGKPEALRVKPDGTIMNGNHRIKVLEERGIDVNKLPREIYNSGK